MSAFSYPLGYSNLLNDVDKRLGFFNYRRREYRSPHSYEFDQIIKQQLKIKTQLDEKVRINFKTGTYTEREKVGNHGDKGLHFDYRDIDPTEAQIKIDLGNEHFQKWTFGQSKMSLEMMKEVINYEGWLVRQGFVFEKQKLLNFWKFCSVTQM